MSSNLSRSLKLNNGLQIPQIGLGVYKADNKECYEICKSALASGWRHIDSAAAYQNEEDVGRAVRESGVSRIELFITTKIFIHEEERAEKLDSIAEVVAAKIDSCLSKLDLGYIDLLLIHAPWSSWFVKYDCLSTRRQGAWPVMESYVTSGKIKSIGVSNFGAQHIGI
jgi:diketogulonate reductase-like aldo/keto reductase